MVKQREYLNKNKQKKIGSSHNKKQKSYRDLPKQVNNDNDDDIIDNIDINEVDDFDPDGDEIIDDNQYYNEYQENEDEYDEIRPKIKLTEKTKQRLKQKIIDWLDYDDKIKALNIRTKKYKDSKKKQEEIIIKMIVKLGMEDDKLDVVDDNENFRGRVYRHKSVTKGPLKEDIIKDALMEAIRDEKKVDQLVKKIESKRPIHERYYLKRTKGNNNK